MGYWFTCNDPHVDSDHHGVWVHTSDEKKAKDAAKGMRVGDLVFIYETKYNRKKTIHNGHSKVVALVGVTNLPFSSGEWTKIAKTKWIAPLDCSEEKAHEITRKGSFEKFGKLDVLKIDSIQALRFLEYCVRRGDYRKLIRKYFPEELEDAQDQLEIEKASPVDYQKTPRKAEFTNTKAGHKVKTKPGIAKRRILIAKHKCEIDSSHQTFTSFVTNENYMEAHHLVPLRAQEKFGENGLDHEANILSLCPNCHRLLHHAATDEREGLVRELFKRRKKELKTAGIELRVEDLIVYYQ